MKSSNNFQRSSVEGAANYNSFSCNSIEMNAKQSRLTANKCYNNGDVVTLLIRWSVPMFNVLKPAEIVGNEVKTFTARTTNNHHSLVVCQLRESLWRTSLAYFACVHDTELAHSSRTGYFCFWYVTCSRYTAVAFTTVTVAFTTVYSAKSNNKTDGQNSRHFLWLSRELAPNLNMT